MRFKWKLKLPSEEDGKKDATCIAKYFYVILSDSFGIFLVIQYSSNWSMTAQKNADLDDNKM